jgi:hypothetical protein
MNGPGSAVDFPGQAKGLDRDHLQGSKSPVRDSVFGIGLYGSGSPTPQARIGARPIRTCPVRESTD